MKLLNKKEYDFVEDFLKSYKIDFPTSSTYYCAIKEIINFFTVPLYEDFLQLFYFERYNFKNRYPDNRSMFTYLSNKLFVQEPTLYMMRKEIVYKSAMILYKYNILE